jgi:hypothetical protein
LLHARSVGECGVSRIEFAIERYQVYRTEWARSDVSRKEISNAGYQCIGTIMVKSRIEGCRIAQRFLEVASSSLVSRSKISIIINDLQGF